jgi:hypothetical protein
MEREFQRALAVTTASCAVIRSAEPRAVNRARNPCKLAGDTVGGGADPLARWGGAGSGAPPSEKSTGAGAHSRQKGVLREDSVARRAGNVWV